jgi:hypothetical protein
VTSKDYTNRFNFYVLSLFYLLNSKLFIPTMNLAEPAPRVEVAAAESAPYTEAATASTPQQSEPWKTSPAKPVEPATTYDPKLHAPECVTKPSNPPTMSLTVAKLRGGSGADLEFYAGVSRGAPEKNFLRRYLPLIFDERDFASYGEVKKYVLIKAGSCFVYGEESDPSPIYAIPLDNVVSILEDRDRPDKGSLTISPLPDSNKSPEGMVTVLLKYRENGKQAYQFTFDTERCDKALPKQFMDLVDQIQTKQGPFNASVIKADLVGKQGMKHQPVI